MTPDERIEALLNRAGQTISDLPKATKYEFAYCLGKEDMELVFGLVKKFEFCWNKENLDLELIDYILHLTDVIDRMETALENVCGERDYLCDRSGCEFCAYERFDGDKMPCRDCTVTKNLYEFAGVPEDWSADDELGDRNGQK